MNIFEKLYCRSYQFVLNKIAMPFVSFPEQICFEGNSSLLKIPAFLQEKGYKRPFIIVSNSVSKGMHYDKFKKLLDEFSFDYFEFKKVKQNPEFKVILEAKEEAKNNNIDSIIAIGGGSIIDTAKAVGALLANKNKKLEQFKGLLKVKKRFPMLIACPTTAGSGSEVTIASVVTNSEAKDKFAINSPNLIPQVAVLDDELLRSLPKNIIANCGMDALTHALEAYLGNALTKNTKKAALEAISLIKTSLLDFYNDPNNNTARSNMLKASYLAGVSFTRSYVGYVHAIAHALGGKYDISHGYANAVILPHLLEKYKNKSSKKFLYLAKLLNLENEDEFIDWVKNLNKEMGIPSALTGIIKEEDIHFLAKHAAKEANPLYPVPLELSEKELETIIKELIKDDN